MSLKKIQDWSSLRPSLLKVVMRPRPISAWFSGTWIFLGISRGSLVFLLQEEKAKLSPGQFAKTHQVGLRVCGWRGEFKKAFRYELV